MQYWITIFNYLLYLVYIRLNKDEARYIMLVKYCKSFERQHLVLSCIFLSRHKGSEEEPIRLKSSHETFLLSIPCQSNFLKLAKIVKQNVALYDRWITSIRVICRKRGVARAKFLERTRISLLEFNFNNI